jgi:tRNA threonylcarbamoyladenosine biosynthesis protein TsaE
MAEIIISKSLEETSSFGIKFAKTLSIGSIVAFFGDLGVGKTTLIKTIVKSLGPDQKTNEPITVTSPTFTYLNIYDTKIRVYHFDLYRIKNINDFYSMGFHEYFSSDGICLIEWAENILEILPKNSIKIQMKHLLENEREIIFS